VSANCDDEGCLRDLIYTFFFKFSRFEFALKKANYWKRGQTKAEPDWLRFIGDFKEAYTPCQSAVKLLESPPRRQIIRNGGLDWADLNFDGIHSSLEKVALLIRTIRNNLFHGGKHGDRSWDDIERMVFLLQYANEVIDRLAYLRDDLHEYYR
jgi:hypothetical protein